MYNKIALSKIRKNYIKIPSQINNFGLSPIAGRMYMLLISLPENFHPSPKYLQSAIGISRNSVYKYLTELLDCNIIEKAQVASEKKTAHYILNFPEKWKRKV